MFQFCSNWAGISLIRSHFYDLSGEVDIANVRDSGALTPGLQLITYRHENDVVAPKSFHFLAHPFRQVIYDHSKHAYTSTTSHFDPSSRSFPISLINHAPCKSPSTVTNLVPAAFMARITK
ncbi:hypothetical protein AVEN_162436-1 [Araneus ventricosus]|uniref:Uncharacterized protein n=1 Tax=Araneus ventricosus TaxID=182803 RepID=A0A4Y2NKZ8_ARAVE|nr:hypothetical protein AVEN_162436-1 [Araneus ventricosus]